MSSVLKHFDWPWYIEENGSVVVLDSIVNLHLLLLELLKTFNQKFKKMNLECVYIKNTSKTLESSSLFSSRTKISDSNEKS